MAISYGIHQDGDSYVINPKLVNGDGFIGLGPEVKVHIGAGSGDDTLITPKLQVTGEAAVGRVMKSADAQGNVTWVNETGFAPYDYKNLYVSYTHEGLTTATESFEAGSSATLAHTPSNPAVNLRVYTGTTSNLTEEVPADEYTVSENTVTFDSALSSAFVVVYSYSSDISVTDEPVMVVASHLPLLHQVKADTEITVKSAPTGTADLVTFVSGTDYNLSPDRRAVELIATGAIVGRTNDRQFVTIDSNGDGRLSPLGNSSSVFASGTFPQTVWAEYQAFVALEEEGTLDSEKGYVLQQTLAPEDIVWVNHVKLSGAEVDPADFFFDFETKTVTVNTGAENDSVTVEFNIIHSYAGSTVNIDSDTHTASLPVPSYGTSRVISANIAPDDHSPSYIPFQDYEVGGDDEHTLILLDYPIPNQILVHGNGGSPIWVNIASLIDNPEGLDLHNKVVVYREGRLVFADSAATVELETLVPEEGRQDSYILAWDGDQQKVVWKLDNDSWPSIQNSSSYTGQVLVSTVSGDTHTASWSSELTLDSDHNFAVTTSGTGTVNLASGNHIDIASSGTGDYAGVDIRAINNDNSAGADVGIKAYSSVFVKTITDDIELSSGAAVSITTNSTDDSTAGGNVSIQAGGSSSSGNGGNISIEAGTSASGNGGNLTLKSGNGTISGSLTLESGNLQIKGLPNGAANMVLYVQNYDPSTGIATLGFTTVDSLVMTSGH